MTLTAPLGLLALLAVPAVVAVHLFRRRLRERRIAALFLFTGERLAAEAGRTRTRLLQSASLWLECAAAAVAAVWLAGPSFGGVPARHVVFVLDDSASMTAAASGAASAQQQAVAELRARAGAVGSGDRVTVLCTGPRPKVVLGPRALPSELQDALAAYRPASPGCDPGPALDLARELAAGGGEVVFCTDEPAPASHDDVTVLSFGRAVPNCAVLTAQRFPVAGGEELRVRVGGFGGAAGTTLSVHAGEQRLLEREIVLADGVADLAVPLPAGLGALRLQLAADAMAIDDVAWLLPAPPRTVAVCDLLTAELRERLALARVFGALEGWVAETDPLAAQLVLSAQPGRLRPGQTEVVIAPGDGERDAWRGPFVIDRGHPWLAGVQLAGVVWLAGRRALPGRVLVAAGNQPLVSEELADEGQRLWLDLDASAGNVPRAPDWPLLWANVLDACRAEVPGPEQQNVVLGAEARYRRALQVGAGDQVLVLEAPDGSRQEGRGLRTVGWIVEQPGLHRVRGAEGRELGAFAARFHDPAESDLRRLVTAVRPAAPRTGDAGSLRELSFERRLLALLLLALCLADWWVLGRRQP